MVAERVEKVAVGGRVYEVAIDADLDDGGYVAAVRGLPGCITEAATLKELRHMAQDAIRSWLEAYEDLKARGIDVPRGD